MDESRITLPAKCNSSCVTKRRLFDTVVCITVATVLILFLGGTIPPRKTGFSCDDNLIKQKYTEDSVSAGLLIAITLLVPVMIISFIELFKFGATSSLKPHRKRKFFGCSRHSSGIVSDYLMGCLLILTLTDVIKTMVSEKRPHFLDSCKPSVNCSSVKSYITDYTCTGHFSKWWLKMDIYKSFPSGHAALSFYMATFMVIYLQKRVSLKISYLLRPILQFSFLIWAFTCSISRITDHRHFWWDVLGGSIIGILGGLSLIGSFEQNFEPNFDVLQDVDEGTPLSVKQSSVIMNKNVEN